VGRLAEIAIPEGRFRYLAVSIISSSYGSQERRGRAKAKSAWVWGKRKRPDRM